MSTITLTVSPIPSLASSVYVDMQPEVNDAATHHFIASVIGELIAAALLAT